MVQKDVSLLLEARGSNSLFNNAGTAASREDRPIRRGGAKLLGVAALAKFMIFNGALCTPVGSVNK